MYPQAPFDPALAPDPYSLLLPTAGPAPGSRLRRRQQIGRATILATARRLLARSPGQFTLRRVAEECGVTVQTLRNGFGRREDLLVAAFNDHTNAVWRALIGFSAGPLVFLDLAQIYHRCAVATPEYLRAMVTSAIASMRPLAAAQKHGAGIKSAVLRGMMRDEMVRPGVDPAALAAHITRLNTFMMYEWAIGGDASDLRQAMIDGNRRLLIGALTPRHAAPLEEWRPAPAA